MTKKSNWSFYLVISMLSVSLSASAALSPALSSIGEAYADFAGLVPMLVTIPPICITLTSLFIPMLLRIFSDKQLTILGLLLILFSGIYPYFIHNFALLLLSRVIMGIGLGLVTTISSSLPARYFIIGNNRNNATGLQAAFSSLGGVLYNFLSGKMADIHWSYVFLVQLLAILPLIVVVFCMPSNQETTKKENNHTPLVSPGSFPFVPETFPLVLLAFFCIMLTVTFPLNFSYYIQNSIRLGDFDYLGSSTFAGIIGSINSFLGFIIGLLFSKISAWFRNLTLPLALMLVSISFFIMISSENPAIFLIGTSLFGMGTSIIYPSFLTNIYKKSPAHLLVASLSMYTIATNIAQFVSPYIINPIANLFGHTIHIRFLVVGVLIFVLSIIMYFLTKEPTNQSTVKDS